MTRYPDNVYSTYDYDYSVHHDATSHHHVAEASRQDRVLKPRYVAIRFLPMTAPDSIGNCRMDVFEDPVTNTVTVTFEIPGVSQDKIAIEVFDSRLTISGEVASFFDENYGYVLKERRTGPFARTLALPANIPVSHESACCVIYAGH